MEYGPTDRYDVIELRGFDEEDTENNNSKLIPFQLTVFVSIQLILLFLCSWHRDQQCFGGGWRGKLWPVITRCGRKQSR